MISYQTDSGIINLVSMDIKNVGGVAKYFINEPGGTTFQELIREHPGAESPNTIKLPIRLTNYFITHAPYQSDTNLRECEFYLNGSRQAASGAIPVVSSTTPEYQFIFGYTENECRMPNFVIPRHALVWGSTTVKPESYPVEVDVINGRGWLREALSNKIRTIEDFYGDNPIPPEPPVGDHCELSTTGGGNGTCSTSGGDLDFHSLPQISAVDLGMVTLYKPTLAQLQEFSSYLWSDSFVVDSLKKMFADPMDVILAVQQFPVSPPDGVDRTVTVGDVSTGIKMTTLPEQYYDLVLDPIRIEPYWDNFLDYAPYTTLTLHLPFIGDRSINPADVMGKVLQVRYIFDMLTGTCLAQILCGDTPTGGTGKHVLYEFAGTCSAQIPIHSRDWGRAISNAISVVGGAATTLASAVTGDVAGAAQGAGGILGTVGSMVSGGMGPQIGRAGGISGSPGLMANRQVYLIRQQPRQSLPSGYGKLYGWPSNITSKLGDLTGYTVVDKIHLDGIPATSTERDEIEALLKGGVIL